MTACLKVIGILLVSIDRPTTLAMNGISSNLHFFSNEFGMGSNMHDLDGDFRTICLISSTETGVNFDKLGKALASLLSKPSDGPKLSLILSIFSIKCWPNFLLILL